MGFEKVTLSRVAIKTEIAIEALPIRDYAENAIDFDGEKDPSNPLNWSTAYKLSIMALISVMGLVVSVEFALGHRHLH